MIQETRLFFQQHYGRPPAHVVLAPGRLEVLGTPAEDPGGMSLALAVDRYVGVAASPRRDGRTVWVSSSDAARVEGLIDRLDRTDLLPWARMVQGVLHGLRNRGLSLTGFDLAVHSNLPAGGGMDAMSALSVAMALLVREMVPFALTKQGLGPAPRRSSKGLLPHLSKSEVHELASWCFGVAKTCSPRWSRRMDGWASLCGRTGQIQSLDLLDGTVQHWPLPADLSLVVCPTVDPGFEAEEGVAAAQQLFAEVAAALGLSSLRTVDARMLEAERARLTRRQAECLAHWVGEQRRIAAAERALRSGDGEAWGALLWQSHESVAAQLRQSTPELDDLVALARRQAGCVGARLTGVGFGGSTLNWVRSAEVPRFIEAIRREAALVRRKVIHPFVCRCVDGAARVGDGAARSES